MNSWRIIIQRARASRLSRLDGHMEGVLQSVSLLGRGYVLTLGLGCGIAIGLLLSLRKNNVSSTARLTGVQV